MERVVETRSPAETLALGRALAAELRPGDVVALVGPLGAGKTLLVGAIVEGLGGDPSRVASPTFALIHEYAAERMPVYHFDAYRLESEAEFHKLGVEEYFAGDGVCLVEWADRVPGALPDRHWRIRIEPADDTTRRIAVQPPSA